MTCIVGYLDSANKRMYIAGDTLGSTTTTKSERIDTKVFIKEKKMLMGFTTSYRMGQLLHWKFKLPNHPAKMSTDEYMYTLFIDEVIKLFTENGYAKVESNQNSGGTFIVLYQGKLYCIEEDYQIAKPLEHFTACGCGESYAHAAISAFEMSDNFDLEFKLENSIKIASKYSTGVNDRVEMLSLGYK
jgi:ATP-dependent protease HslVU (ClpYQ) peptidase subunit